MKMPPEQMRQRYAELTELFYQCGCDDDKVMDAISDDSGEVSDSDFWILRAVLATYQINGKR